ncbi:MAG: aromatic amino acid lyase [Paludibacteraceae bacterium]|nr:aromatic amino acid lyase [Paludibacteraceae bacterium]
MNLKDLEAVATGRQPFEVRPQQQAAVERAYSFLEKFSTDKVIYGINTGFGPMAQYRVTDEHLQALQYNIIRSHSTGAGEPMRPEWVRAAMVSRLCAFLNGKSGVHPETIAQLTAFLNNDIVPVVPQHGSVGASGDLVQLAHISLALIGEGEVFYRGQRCATAEALRQANLKPLKLHLRDGLALTNGTAMMTGIGCMVLMQAQRLLDKTIVCSVLMNEIAASYDDCLSAELNDLKGHEGQTEVARRMREAAQGSQCLQNRADALYHRHTEATFQHKVQPYYSLRCVPQILGPVYETLRHTCQILEEELNGVDDNPIVDPEHEMVYHGGNFHGDYVSFEMDKLKIAVTKMTMLVERQVNYLFHDRINGILPPFVNLGVLGLNYGLQAAQFTATSTTAECQTLSNPMYVHSIPNNNDNQDIVSMGTNSALIASRVVDNACQVFSIYLMALAQAVDCLKIDGKLAPATAQLYREVRELVPAFVEDTPKYEEISRLTEYLKH